MDLNSYFKFIALELEGKNKKENLFGIKKSIYPEKYDRVLELINSEKTKETANKLVDIVMTHYNTRYVESKADEIFPPLKYYYFDFWLNAEKHSVIILQKALNKFFDSNITEYGTFGIQTEKALKSLGSIPVSKVCRAVTYFNTKRSFFHISLADRKYRCNWVVRVLKLQAYVNSNFNI